MLVKYREVWEEFLVSCVHAYNIEVHELTLFSPFELMFGRTALLPIDTAISDQVPGTLMHQLAGEDDEVI